MKKPLVFLFLLFVFENVLVARASGIYAGQVISVTGIPEVLRNPVSAPNDTWHRSAEKRGYVVAVYDGRYWESHQVKAGMKLYYGDRLSSGGSGQTVVSFDDGIEITVPRDSIFKLSRTVIKEQNQSTFQRWVSLISGAIRAKAQKSEDANRTKFRSGSIAMGVRGTEFVIENRIGLTKVLTIEGEVAVREISPEEQQLFESITEGNDGLQNDKSKMGRDEIRLQKLSQANEMVAIKAGMKIEHANTPEPAGMALTQKRTSATKLKPTAISQVDSQLLESVELQPIVAQKPESDQIQSKPQSPDVHLVMLSLANAALTLDLGGAGEIDLDGVGLGIDYRWLFHRFMDFGAFLIRVPKLDGNIAAAHSNSSSGRFDKPVTLTGLRFGGRFNLKKWTFGLGLHLSSISDFEAIFETESGTEYVHYETKIHPMIVAGLGYQFSQHLHGLLELSGTEVVFKAPANSSAVLNEETEHGFSLIRLAAGWSF